MFYHLSTALARWRNLQLKEQGKLIVVFYLLILKFKL
jgi:hypothetical protein